MWMGGSINCPQLMSQLHLCFALLRLHPLILNNSNHLRHSLETVNVVVHTEAWQIFHPIHSLGEICQKKYEILISSLGG